MKRGTLADLTHKHTIVTGWSKGADFDQVDSMSPEYPSGSVIKKNEKAFIEWGKTYVLDTENGAVIKNIRRTDNPEVIECVSQSGISAIHDGDKVYQWMV